jgi:hypothetical protein
VPLLIESRRAFATEHLDAQLVDQQGDSRVERVTGIEPALSAWENQRQAIGRRQNPLVPGTPRIWSRPRMTGNDRPRPLCIARLSLD